MPLISCRQIVNASHTQPTKALIANLFTYSTSKLCDRHSTPPHRTLLLTPDSEKDLHGLMFD